MLFYILYFQFDFNWQHGDIEVNKRSKIGVLAIALLLMPVAAHAETTCTGTVRNVPGNMIYVDNTSARARARTAQFPPLELPAGTPVCGFIGFMNTDNVSVEHMREAGAGALHFVCDTPGLVAQMQGRFVVSGTCTLADGATVTWYVRPRPQ